MRPASASFGTCSAAAFFMAVDASTSSSSVLAETTGFIMGSDESLASRTPRVVDTLAAPSSPCLFFLRRLFLLRRRRRSVCATGFCGRGTRNSVQINAAEISPLSRTILVRLFVTVSKDRNADPILEEDEARRAMRAGEPESQYSRKARRARRAGEPESK